MWENRKIDSLNDKLYIIWQLRIGAAPSFSKICVIRRIFFIVLKEFKPEPAFLSLILCFDSLREITDSTQPMTKGR